MTKFTVSSVAIGGDHAGYSLKSLLAEFLIESGIRVVDCGPADDCPCDFPDFAEAVLGNSYATTCSGAF